MSEQELGKIEQLLVAGRADLERERAERQAEQERTAEAQLDALEKLVARKRAAVRAVVPEVLWPWLGDVEGDDEYNQWVTVEVPGCAPIRVELEETSWQTYTYALSPLPYVVPAARIVQPLEGSAELTAWEYRKLDARRTGNLGMALAMAQEVLAALPEVEEKARRLRTEYAAKEAEEGRRWAEARAEEDALLGVVRGDPVLIAALRLIVRIVEERGGWQDRLEVAEEFQERVDARVSRTIKELKEDRRRAEEYGRQQADRADSAESKLADTKRAARRW